MKKKRYYVNLRKAEAGYYYVDGSYTSFNRGDFLSNDFTKGLIVTGLKTKESAKRIYGKFHIGKKKKLKFGFNMPFL